MQRVLNLYYEISGNYFKMMGRLSWQTSLPYKQEPSISQCKFDNLSVIYSSMMDCAAKLV